jgi:DNA-binding LacI/PurR family transcriptional regulator
MKRITIADVAAKAGVSKSTVSHALSGKRPISIATRRRIQQAVDLLGYQPNPVAQRLAGGRTRTIGYVYPLFAPEIASLEMKFITSTANVINSADYALMMLTHPIHDVDSLQRFISSGLVDGFILMQAQLVDPRVELLQRTKTPFVLIGRCADNADIWYVDLDIGAAMNRCVTHLAELGHTSLAYLCQDNTEFGFAFRAQQEFTAACQTRHITSYRQPCGASEASANQAMQDLLQRHPDITGVIAWNSMAAWSAIQAAQSGGRTVPDNLSIITFGDSDLTPQTGMQLTVLDILPEEMAARAAQLLLAKLADETLPESQIQFTPDLIVRDSTAVAQQP